MTNGDGTPAAAAAAAAALQQAYPTIPYPGIGEWPVDHALCHFYVYVNVCTIDVLIHTLGV